MVLDLKLCRFENASWGFRLIGGADFDVPLTVVKVSEGSLAEQAGMRVGDVIVRINDEPACNMSHNDAHQVIMHCGNTFFLGINREEENEECHENGSIENPSPRPELFTPESMVESSAKSPISEVSEEILRFPVAMGNSVGEKVTKDDNGVEEKVTEDEIAEMMSGEAEVLKEHNVIGVNFNRIFPKAGICQSSEVFRTLNEEAVKTKIEREKDKRKWTTFLQKPDRPVPKSKQQLEEEARIPYRVKIVKQPKPRVAPDRIPTPPVEVPEPEPEPPEPEIPVEEAEPEPPPTDSEVPNLEPLSNENGTMISTDEIFDEAQTETEVNDEPTEIEEQIDEAVAVEVVQKSQEEMLLEKQLSDVQKQLLALSTLPSTIQATLDSVTKQLAELLPNFRLQPSPMVEVEIQNNQEEHSCLQNDEEVTEVLATETNITETNTTENYIESHQSEITEDVYIEETYEEQNFEDEIINEVEKREPTAEELREIEAQRERKHLEEELNYKKQKELVRLELEHRQRLIRERAPRRPPRPFGPLTPQERPLILPGGRRWRQPKDAFNDEFIAETLSSQAELITGTTLGVNFLKYQKPEKHIDLEKSEVYKVIHHLERQPRRGIEIRPAKVQAEADVRSCATPISCG